MTFLSFSLFGPVYPWFYLLFLMFDMVLVSDRLRSSMVGGEGKEFFCGGFLGGVSDGLIGFFSFSPLFNYSSCTEYPEGNTKAGVSFCKMLLI